ncbi:MAG: serine acetyltransferase [Verrucomicrobia bacterium]|nr:serine acetyltransferase [Kiritimatiellia bacterium]MCP5488892.1 serine acetyltransferase [Verrucomicrobiota bacterium]
MDRADSLLQGYPNPCRVVHVLQLLHNVMFPGKWDPETVPYNQLESFLAEKLEQVRDALLPELRRALPFRWMGQAWKTEGYETLDADGIAEESVRVLDAFLARLPVVRDLLIEDVKAAYDGDPAALSYAEVKLAYPGLAAITSHRIAHEFYTLNVPIIPRIMSERTHAETGVDINPGARIGHGFFIDHATGVVIGETTEIGNRVKIYQGVTLGARSFPLDENGNPIKHIKRHPTVEDEVVIYANATILGGDTVIGRGSTVGGNVFLMESVPPNSFVAAKHPELRILKR